MTGLVLACASDLAWAQGSGGSKTKAAGGGAHGGGQSGMPGATKKDTKKGDTKKTPPPPTPLQPGDPQVDSKTGIPLGFEPKKDVPDVITLDKPLGTVEEIQKWKKDQKTWATLLRNGELTPASKAAIIAGLKYRLAILTLNSPVQEETLSKLKEKPQDLATLRDSLVQNLNNGGLLLTKPQDVKAFRQWLMEETVKQIEPLLQGNFYVRIHAATLLGELALTNEDKKNNVPFLAFTAATEPLRGVLRDADQPEAVKITAARSMIKLIRFGDLPANKKFDTTRDVLAEVAKTTTHYWYQMRLVELLSTIASPRDEAQKPVIVNQLVAILRDPNRHWHVRAEAAKALGRASLDPQINISSLMQDIVQFALEMAKAAQQQPKASQWEMTFFKLYLAFQSIDAAEKDAAKKARAGFLNNPATTSAAATPYSLILPLVNTVINGQPITAAQVSALENWLSNARPQAANQANGPAKAPAGNGAGPAAAVLDANERKVAPNE